MDAPPRRRAWPLALLLFAATLALYARTARFPFVEYDDPAYVRDNPHLAGGLTTDTVAWAFTSTRYQYNWHPLTWLSHALDVQLFGREPGPEHLVNAGLHALSAALLLLAFAAMSARVWASAFAAALFALHPLRVESVAWIAERKDVLAGTFFALALLLYVRHARAPSRARLAAVALALAAGLMAKPTLVTAPFVLLLLDAWPLRRFAPSHDSGLFHAFPAFPARALLLEKLPLFALSLGASAVTLLAQHGGGAFRASIALPERIANAGLACLTYLRQYAWPCNLAVFYPHPALVEPGRSHVVSGCFAWLALALLAGWAWRIRRSWPWVPIGLAWFLGVLVPMSGLLQVGYLAHADRYVYLAALGLELALAFSAAELVRVWPRTRTAVVAFAIVWLGALALRANDQLGLWRDSRTLFEHALAVTDGNFVAHNNLGLVLATANEPAEALAHFEEAARLLPGFHEAEYNAGRARYERGDYDLAREAFERAVAARPESAEAHLFLSATLVRLRAIDAAERELAAALERDPRLADDARVAALRAVFERQRSK